MPLFAALPDPADSSVVALCATLGAFLGVTVSRSRGKGHEHRSRAAMEGGYLGTAVGISVLAIANLSAILG